MVWDEETIAHLRNLWTQGLSTAEIGRRLGVSKNAIVGKAHRLDLDARPSPIRRASTKPHDDHASAHSRLAGPTLPPLASTAVQPLTVPMTSGSAKQEVRQGRDGPGYVKPEPRFGSERPMGPAAVPMGTAIPGGIPPGATMLGGSMPGGAPGPRVLMPSATFHARRSAPSCCWPIGEPGTKSFRFCDDASLPGKPYCDEHARLAYVKVRDRKEDAA